MTSVQAATLLGPRQLEVRSYPYPDVLEPGAVLLRMLASGICGTDKHTYRGETEQYAGTEHARSTPYPIIQGHENVGVVEAIGAGGARARDGSPLAVGDRVVPAPNRACGECRMCARGFPYYLCRNIENYGNSLTSDDAPAGDSEPNERVISSDGATRLIVTSYIGIGNRLFIRGEGPGLAWDKGVPLQFISIGKWRWETADSTAPVTFKLYKNDDVECPGLGALTLDAGYQQEVTAKF